MTQEAYCSYEVAKLLKEKGFNERSAASYDSKGQLQEGYGYWNKTPIWYAAPTHQMTVAWLSKIHKIFIEVYLDKAPNFEYTVFSVVWDNGLNSVWRADGFTTCEQAVEAALKYTLENLI